MTQRMSKQKILNKLWDEAGSLEKHYGFNVSNGWDQVSGEMLNIEPGIPRPVAYGRFEMLLELIDWLNE